MLNRKKVIAVMILICFFFCGCGNKSEVSLRQVKEDLTELAPEDTVITARVLHPYVMTRAPLTVDMLKSEQSERDQELIEYGIEPPLTVKEFRGEKTKEIRKILLENIDPADMVPVEEEGYMKCKNLL